MDHCSGSTIGENGSLAINFVDGGVWEVPLSPKNRVGNPDATASLVIEKGGQFKISGKGTLFGNVQSELEEGEHQKYILVKKSFSENNGLNLDLSSLSLTTNKPEYVFQLEQENQENEGFLYATLAHEQKSQLEIPETTSYSSDDIPLETWAEGKNITPLSSSFSQQLPVHMVDQILAFSPFYMIHYHRRIVRTPHSTTWIESVLMKRTSHFHCGALPLYDHISGKNFDTVSGKMGFEANIRGLGLQLMKQTQKGNISVGLFNGQGDISFHRTK